MTKADSQTIENFHGTGLWKLPTVLQNFPVSRSAWLAGVKSGRYPAPVRLSARSVAWRAADVAALVASL